MRAIAILEWLKSELEKNYKFQKSALTQSGPGKLGLMNNFVFESEQVAIDIAYFNTGIIYMGGFEMMTENLFMDFSFVPEEYHTKDYPKESEEILIHKINELLSFLRSKNPNLKTHAPSNV